jgi:hypothetical protein
MKNDLDTLTTKDKGFQRELNYYKKENPLNKAFLMQDIFEADIEKRFSKRMTL